MNEGEVAGRYIDVRGVEVYYESVAGENRAPVMLFLHSEGRDGRQWQRHLEHFGDRYRAIAVDMPGHHKSSPLPGHRCIDEAGEYADFIWAFLDAVGTESPPVIVGNSLGAVAAFRIAAEHPQEVKAVIGFSAASAPSVDGRLIGNPHIHLGQYMADRDVARLGERAPADVRAFVDWTALQMTKEAEYADVAVLADPRASGELDQVACPCLLVGGADDWLVTTDVLDGVAAELSAAPLVVVRSIEGVGHMPHLEAADETISLMEDFLAELDETGSGPADGRG